ncbi:hypothetical protein SAMN05216266_11486 [Amycolatopsis marina]|uniref:Uncharacterized protein n=1 Tax=Amycolatopsis marina TaxID=490629 RepID=A0A1I1BHR7_9PSEU|nr:hypothetical protein SAMN05216266_11486 [Amycolatopsis marina]
MCHYVGSQGSYLLSALSDGVSCPYHGLDLTSELCDSAPAGGFPSFATGTGPSSAGQPALRTYSRSLR